MSISGIGATNSWSSLFRVTNNSTSASSSTGAAKGMSLQADLAQLGQDLDARDLSTASSDYSTIISRMKQGNAGNTSFTSAMSSLQTALTSGDLSAAKEAFSKVQDAAASMPPPPPPPDGASPGGSTGGSTGMDSLKSLFDSLGSALDSGDISSAQSMFQMLQQMLQNGSTDSSSSSSSSNILRALKGIDVTA